MSRLLYVDTSPEAVRVRGIRSVLSLLAYIGFVEANIEFVRAGLPFLSGMSLAALVGYAFGHFLAASIFERAPYGPIEKKKIETVYQTVINGRMVILERVSDPRPFYRKWLSIRFYASHSLSIL